MSEFSERFECRTLPETYPWFCNFAFKHGYINHRRNKASYKNKRYYKTRNAIVANVNLVLIAIKDGEFKLAKTGVVAVVNKTSSQRTEFFRCCVTPGTLDWFKLAAYQHGYKYGDDGAVNRLLEAIMFGEVSIEKVEE